MDTQITRHDDGSATVTTTFSPGEASALGPDLVGIADVASGLWQAYVTARGVNPPSSAPAAAAVWSDVLDAVRVGRHHVDTVQAVAIRGGSVDGDMSLSQVADRLGMAKNSAQYHWTNARTGKHRQTIASASQTPGAVPSYGTRHRTWRGPITGWTGWN